MKKRKKYTMSNERKLADLKRVNFDKRIQIITLRNQGWSFNELGRKFKCAPQGIQELYKKISNMTVEDLENQRKLILDT